MRQVNLLDVFPFIGLFVIVFSWKRCVALSARSVLVGSKCLWGTHLRFISVCVEIYILVNVN